MTAFLFFKQACDLKCFVIIIAFKVANSANHCKNIHTRYEEKQEGEDEEVLWFPSFPINKELILDIVMRMKKRGQIPELVLINVRGPLECDGTEGGKN